MEREGMDFEGALKLAQSLGYAETIDPSADVDGIDAQRKICILASILFGRHFYPQNVAARGIRDVSCLLYTSGYSRVCILFPSAFYSVISL